MSSNNSTVTSKEDDYEIADAEWVVIVVVLVIVLIVLIITVIKCLERAKPPSDKSLLQNDFQSVRSGGTTVRSVASSKKMKKMPLNAEITRFSAGRQSRSAEYGVVIKDIGKSVQTEGTTNGTTTSPPHYEHSNTMQDLTLNRQGATQEPRYVQQGTQQRPAQNGTLTSPPNAAMIVDRDFATTGRAKPDSRAVFVAPEEPFYSTMTAANRAPMRLPTQAAVPVQIVDMGNTYQVVQPRPMQTQPVVLMQ